MSKIKEKLSNGLFDGEFILDKLSSKGDPLERLNKMIRWEIFQPLLNRIFAKEPKGKGGRPHYDYLLMFKILILQRLYNVSDEQMEYLIIDRLSFRRFLGLGFGDDVPDEKTIWLFRETIATEGSIQDFFDRFKKELQENGLMVNNGTIVDATIVDVPRQRQTKDEKKQLENGNIPEEWKENPAKLRQKDCDARWTKKRNRSYYGYKNHIKICKKTKFIQTFEVTPANVHDSQVFEPLLERADSHHEIFADSAYSGNPIAQELRKRKIRSRINEKGVSNKPLTDRQKEKNKVKSKVRARVEHIFGFMENSMNRIYIRCVGVVRSSVSIGLMNLTYNIKRFIQLKYA